MSDRHPAETSALFQHDRVADGYASARPYLHPAVMQRVAAALGLRTAVPRALDVGCGTGMSTAAMRALADEVVGTDAATAMLTRARRAPGIGYTAAAAEVLPFRAGSFDLVLACGSMDWIDRGRFVPAAAALLRPRGWLVSLDFGDTGRSPDVPGLASWYDDVFLGACPRPASDDPYISAEEAAAAGLSGPAHETFELPCVLAPDAYADFLMTESNVVLAVEYGGRTAAELRRWLGSELADLFGNVARTLTFAGYIQSCRRQG